MVAVGGADAPHGSLALGTQSCLCGEKASRFIADGALLSCNPADELFNQLPTMSWAGPGVPS